MLAREKASRPSATPPVGSHQWALTRQRYGHRKEDCWCWQQKQKDKEKQKEKEKKKKEKRDKEKDEMEVGAVGQVTPRGGDSSSSESEREDWLFAVEKKAVNSLKDDGEFNERDDQHDIYGQSVPDEEELVELKMETLYVSEERRPPSVIKDLDIKLEKAAAPQTTGEAMVSTPGSSEGCEVNSTDSSIRRADAEWHEHIETILVPDSEVPSEEEEQEIFPAAEAVPVPFDEREVLNVNIVYDEEYETLKAMRQEELAEMMVTRTFTICSVNQLADQMTKLPRGQARIILEPKTPEKWENCCRCGNYIPVGDTIRSCAWRGEHWLRAQCFEKHVTECSEGPDDVTKKLMPIQEETLMQMPDGDDPAQPTRRYRSSGVVDAPTAGIPRCCGGGGVLWGLV